MSNVSLFILGLAVTTILGHALEGQPSSSANRLLLADLPNESTSANAVHSSHFQQLSFPQKSISPVEPSTRSGKQYIPRRSALLESVQTLSMEPSQATLPESDPLPLLTAISQQPMKMLSIERCGTKPGDANFRRHPTFSPAAILGVIKAGSTIHLTGEKKIAEGEVWYMAIAPELHPSNAVSAQNQLQPNQTGWISSCFID